MFSTHSITNFNSLVIFILSSAHAFHLELSKIPSSGRVLRPKQRIRCTTFSIYEPVLSETVVSKSASSYNIFFKTSCLSLESAIKGLKTLRKSRTFSRFLLCFEKPLSKDRLNFAWFGLTLYQTMRF